jgi:hypothetical protein
MMPACQQGAALRKYSERQEIGGVTAAAIGSAFRRVLVRAGAGDAGPSASALGDGHQAGQVRVAAAQGGNAGSPINSSRP